MSLWDALRMNMMISYQELVRTFPWALFTWSCMFIVSAAQADEATAIMAIKDTRIFFMVGSPVFSYPNNQCL
jgi:hypothetical protein